MLKNKIKVSVIIVHYNVEKELYECIESIYNSKPKTPFEIIVVDNDEVKTIEKSLLKKFPKIKYVKNVNNGWGGGVNKGLGYASGEYIYLLNPDTIFLNNAIDAIIKFSESNRNVGVAGSLLYDKNKKVYGLQGTRLLNPLNAIFSLSFINKFFPNNPISRKFWMRGWDKSKIKQVESATLSAALIKKEVFIEAGKFDENIFLYYEEYDLAKRLDSLGYKNYIVPSSKVLHLWEVSTSKTGRTNEFIKNSRRYYFKKYYGVLTAYFVEFFLSMDKRKAFEIILFISILTIGIFLRFHKIMEYAPFIGDQAWFYISARDAMLSGQTPLLGITSSHTWIHQGPLWTYLLIPVLMISNFHPLSGVILSSSLGVMAVIMSYILGKNVLSSKFGLIFAFIFAVSPLVVFHSRFAYHTTPIPLFVLMLFYAVWKWTQGRVVYFPVIMFLMSILYNLELATVIFWPVILLYFVYGLLKRKEFVFNLKNKKLITFSIIGLLLPMIPIIIYDLQNGFTQTVVFGGWFFYKGLQFLGIFEKSVVDNSSIINAFNFFIIKFEQLAFPFGKTSSLIVLVGSLLGILISVFKTNNKEILGVVLGITGIGLLAYFVSGVPSEAYLVMLFPGLLFIIAYFINLLKSKYLIILSLLILGVTSINYLIKSNYLTDNLVTMKNKIQASNEIVNIVGNSNYALRYRGPGQEFISSVMPYEYLTWWITKDNQLKEGSTIRVLVEEKEKNIYINLVPE